MMSGNNEDIDLKLTNGTAVSSTPVQPVHAKMFQLIYTKSHPHWAEH
jgi:hypothetical protein